MKEVPQSFPHADKQRIDTLVQSLLQFAQVGGLGTLDRTPGSPAARHYAFEHKGDSYMVFITIPENGTSRCIVHMRDGESHNSLILDLDGAEGLQLNFRDPQGKEVVIGFSEDGMTDEDQIIRETMDGLAPIFNQELDKLKERGVLVTSKRVEIAEISQAVSMDAQ